MVLIVNGIMQGWGGYRTIVAESAERRRRWQRANPKCPEADFHQLLAAIIYIIVAALASA